MSAFCRCVAIVTAVLFPWCAAAEISALLVGVSDYDDATGIADLRGPPNDMRLLQRVLSNRGVDRITVLADGVDGAKRPTRAAVLQAFAAQAASAEAGDFVYIHLSGHGTRQKDQNGDETDGLDEVFLAADTTHGEPGTGLIGNAITDDEIGQAVDAIRAKGADVWLVMDSCHSGSGLRSGLTGVATRFVDPAVLGVSTSVGDTTVTSDTTPTLPEGAGGVIAFYAAQSSEVARELNMASEGAPEEWFGLFTAKLAARLDSGNDTSFRQLFQAVLRDMNDQSVPGAARLQTPLWEGGLIDAAVFGGAETTGIRRFNVNGDELAAGLVHGLTDGTLLGLVSDVSAGPDAQMGVAQLELTEAIRAYLRPVSDACQPVSTALCDPVGQLPPDARFAHVLARPTDLTVKIAVPVALSSGALLEPAHPAHVALRDAVDEAGSRSLPVSLSADDFQVETVWDGERLWFGARAAVAGVPVGLGVEPNAEDLTQILERVARAEHLARLLATAGGTPSMLNPNPLRVAAQLAPVDAADLARPDQNLSPQRECRAAIGRRDPGASGPLTGGAELKQCDGLSFSAQGLVPGARDVNRIHIDAKYCVHASHERVEDTKAARRIGPDMTICSDCPGGYSAGEERLFVLVSEAQPNAAPLNLEGLVETCAAEVTRSGSSGELAGFLGALAQRRTTRGNMGAMGVADIWVEPFNWTVLPKSEVFARQAADRSGPIGKE